MSIVLHDTGIAIADDQSNILPTCTLTKPVSFKSVNDYSRYIMSCLVEINKDNLIFYRIPRSLRLYRGDPSYSEDKISYPSGQKSFNFNAEDASNQGIIHEFVVENEVLLIAMDRVSNVEMLMAHAIANQRQDVAQALNHNFHVDRSVVGRIKLVRQTNAKMDQIILDYVCSLGYSGLAFKPLGHHPAQIMLCETHNVFAQGDYSKYNSTFTQRLNKPF